MAVNFNGTTPAAPALGINVIPQFDGSGNVSAYVPGGGVPATAVDLTAQTADIAPATLYAVPSGAAGMYRVSAFIIVTQAASTSSTIPAVNIIFHDNDNNTSQTLAVTVTDAGNALTTFEQGVVVMNVKDGTTIQYSTVGTASVGGTVLNYALHLRLEVI